MLKKFQLTIASDFILSQIIFLILAFLLHELVFSAAHSIALKLFLGLMLSVGILALQRWCWRVSSPMTRISLAIKARREGRRKPLLIAKRIFFVSTAASVIYFAILLFGAPIWKFISAVYFISQLPVAIYVYLYETLALLSMAINAFFRKNELIGAVRHEIYSDVFDPEKQKYDTRSLEEDRNSLLSWLDRQNRIIKRSSVNHPIPFFEGLVETALAANATILIALFALCVFTPIYDIHLINTESQSNISILLSVLDVIIQYTLAIITFGVLEIDLPLLSSQVIETTTIWLGLIFKLLSFTLLFLVSLLLTGPANLYLDLLFLSSSDPEAIRKSILVMMETDTDIEHNYQQSELDQAQVHQKD